MGQSNRDISDIIYDFSHSHISCFTVTENSQPKAENILNLPHFF